MTPLVMQLCVASMKEEGYASITLARDMGILLNCMTGCIQQSDADMLIGFYIDLSHRGLDIRKYNYQNTDSSQVSFIFCFF